jgi:4-hydroxy-tetrahydrodipicolinate synthase
LPAFWPWAPPGESPTLAWEEHHRAVQIISQKAKGKCLCIAGAGSNNTKEALSASRHAAEAGADAVLLVDPYYNGPSSLEIRKEYIAPVAAAFPDLTVIPYVIPGRTGAQLFPEDLALLLRITRTSIRSRRRREIWRTCGVPANAAGLNTPFFQATTG